MESIRMARNTMAGHLRAVNNISWRCSPVNSAAASITDDRLLMPVDSTLLDGGAAVSCDSKSTRNSVQTRSSSAAAAASS
jgi:hypothetical protein